MQTAATNVGPLYEIVEFFSSATILITAASKMAAALEKAMKQLRTLRKAAGMMS